MLKNEKLSNRIVCMNYPHIIYDFHAKKQIYTNINFQSLFLNQNLQFQLDYNI